MKNKNNISLKILLSIIGLFILGVGVSFTIQSNLGTDPASTLELGVSKILNICYGACAAIYNIILLTIIFFIDKKYINISSILAIFIIGYTAEIFNFFLSFLNIQSMPYFVRILFCILGCFIISIGVTIYIFSDLGVGATDCIAEIISDKTKLSYRTIRIISDLLLVLSGFLIGGPVGLGTIIIAFFTGFFISLSRKILYNLLKTLANNEKIEKINSDDDNFKKEIII